MGLKVAYEYNSEFDIVYAYGLKWRPFGHVLLQNRQVLVKMVKHWPKWPKMAQMDYPFEAFRLNYIRSYIYSATHQYLNKFSKVFGDNQWFGRNQIYLKLKLGATQFMPGIKNLNLIFF
jgi:hypothetical protein